MIVVYRKLKVLLPALLIGLSCLLVTSPAQAIELGQEVQTSWRLLDYIAVDYREAVRGGRVINAAEYREMEEFSSSVSNRLAALPARPARAKLIADAGALRAEVAAKAEPSAIATRARSLASSLLAAYPVPLAPSTVPDPRRGAALYAENCASCHGAKGEGGTGEFARLDPPPIAFADRQRADERSVFSLYQVISQGLEGTAMQSFASLPEEDRWALAFHAGSLAYPDVERGKAIWRDDPSVRRLVPSMAALTGITPSTLAAQIGPEKASAIIAYLRANPDALASGRPEALDLARAKLRQSLEAYARGERDKAGDLALSAYLDGFEPVEPVLATRDGALMGRVESALAGFRSAIASGEPEARLRQRLDEIERLLDQAEAALAPEAASDLATFLGAFAILLREGLEALLVVIAMIAFLRKAERPEALPYVHGGWVGALVAGA
ncbi:MAG TPA: c-type cytochrome, partial [Sphingomicrobium sp.]|nr:c-type cytochrome [Sphingomicrobium sp.]